VLLQQLNVFDYGRVHDLSSFAAAVIAAILSGREQQKILILSRWLGNNCASKNITG